MADDFDALPRALQLRVDTAFDIALTPNSSNERPQRKRRKLDTVEPTGGFILEGDVSGGSIHHEEQAFCPDEDDLIPFSLIPGALQILDLPPDDLEVLQVFRNAASGWSDAPGVGSVHVTNGTEGEGGTVSRRDWRAVCAVIIDKGAEDIASGGNVAGGFLIEDEGVTASVEGHDEGEGDEDAYEDAYEESMSSLSDDQDVDSDSDDEYLTHPSTSNSKAKAKVKHTRRRSPATTAPTSRQKRVALETYALFFSSSPPLSGADLEKERLMFKDIARIADLLKEKLKAEEVRISANDCRPKEFIVPSHPRLLSHICFLTGASTQITEMLSFFSTAPDKSISFEDFTHMMILAKLA